MAILKVFKQNTEVLSIELDTQKEYIGGRSPQCDVFLSDSTISRQHIKIYFDGHHWKIINLARFGTLIQDGHKVNEATLDTNSSIGVEDYTLSIEELNLEVQKDKPNASNVVSSPSLMEPSAINSSSQSTTNDESTAIAQIIGQPCLKIYDPNDGKEKTVLLTAEHHWVIGRSKSCNIHIEDNKASRKHLEIVKTSNGFEISDLGSSNGTLFNGFRLNPHEPTPLRSGDQIIIGKTQFFFELRDPNFEERVKQSLSLVPSIATQHNQPTNLSLKAKVRGQKVWINHPTLKKYFGQDKKTQTIRIFLFGILIMVGLNALLPSPQRTSMSSDSQNASRNTDPFEKMSKEQRLLIENSYGLAVNLYNQSKFEAALTEIRKLHILIPEYRDSKQIEFLAQTAVENKAKHEELQRKKREEEALLRLIRQEVTTCESKWRSSWSLNDTRKCLSKVLELDPENAQARSLIAKTQAEIIRKEEVAAARREREESVKEGIGMFNVAKGLEERGKLDEAVEAYQKFVASDVADPFGNKNKARNRVNDIKNRINTETQNALKSADSFKAQSMYKEALETLQKAKLNNPHDPALNNKYDEIYSELTSKLKELYRESIFEEDTGNLELAKKKWSQILKLDLPTGEYYRKSLKKLERYGR